MAEVDDVPVVRARSAKPHQRAKSARHRTKHANEVNKSEMSAGSLSSVDSGTESVHQEDHQDDHQEDHQDDHQDDHQKEQIGSSEDDLSPPRDPNEPVKRVDQTIPWKKERPVTSVSTRRQRPKSHCGVVKPRNSNRPKSCHITSQYTPDHPGYVEYLRPFSAFRPPLKRVVNIPDAFSNSYLLQHPNLSEGQKTYLWHTASVYSVSNLKQLQQRRYEQMIQHQVDIGLHNPKDCDRYIKYLLGERRRQFEVDPKIWRNPPRIAPRGRYYHKRDKTVDYESWEDEDDDEQDSRPRRPQTAVSSSKYGRQNTSRRRPQTANTSKSHPQTANTSKTQPQNETSTEKSQPQPVYERRFPSGQPTDKQLYYDTKDRQLKLPDQREKEEKTKKEKREKKKNKDRESVGKKTNTNEIETNEENGNSVENQRKKEQKHERKNDEEIENKKTHKKPNRKKEGPKRASLKKDKENTKEKDKKVRNSGKKSVKKEKPQKEPETEIVDDSLDADDRAIETVQQDNKTNNTDTQSTTDTKPTQDTEDKFNSQIQIFVAEEPNEIDDLEEEEEYDDISENPIFENRLKKQQQEDTVSVYSSFSVDIPITKAQAPSELEY